MSDSRLIPLGVITAPHGIRGQVKIRSFTEYPDEITAYGPLTDKAGKAYNITVSSHNKDVLIATIKGVTSRDEAELLRNIELCVPRSALPEADENEYYYEDMVGLNVVTTDGSAFGTITAIHNFGAGDLVAIKLINGSEELLPFSKKTFTKIDIKNRIVTIVLPEVIGEEE